MEGKSRGSKYSTLGKTPTLGVGRNK